MTMQGSLVYKWFCASSFTGSLFCCRKDVVLAGDPDIRVGSRKMLAFNLLYRTERIYAHFVVGVISFVSW